MPSRDHLTEPAWGPAGRAQGTPGLSVVIPVLNGEATLGAQLDALATAHPPDCGFEVVVADNGSQDATVRIARDYADRLPVRIVDAADAPGSNHARNCGIRAASTDRILLCDSDDRVDHHWLVEMAKAFDQGHQLVVGPIDYRELNPAHVLAWRGAQRASAMTILGFLPAGHGANMALTRELFDALDGFDEAFEFGGPDIEFCWRAQLAGFALHTAPDAVVHYRLRPSLTALFRQSRAYGAAEAHLYRAFAAQGLHRRPATAPLRDLWWLLTRLPFVRPVGRRGAWLRRLGQQIGRVEGSLRYRVVWW